MTILEHNIYGICMPSYDEEFDEDFNENEEDLEEEEGFILACEDCDYRWRMGGEDDESDDYDSSDHICPMCGSSNVLEI